MAKQNKFNQADKKGGNDNCLTPPWIIHALGEFDLDPCFGRPRPWNTAKRMFALEDDEDGLKISWDLFFTMTRVWLNQPYSQAGQWAELMALHNNGVMLTFARTETTWFQQFVFGKASGLFFFRKRLNFYDANGNPIRTKSGRVSNAGAPSVLISYDDYSGTPLNFLSIQRAKNEGKLEGFLVPLRKGLWK